MFYSESGALWGGRTRKTFSPAGWVAEDTTKRSDSWLPRREGLLPPIDNFFYSH